MDVLKEKIRTIPDFPKPGILFYDITTVLQDPVSFGAVLEALAEPFQRKKIEAIASIESRGFIFGSAIANELGAGFIPIRKPGKLPYETLKQEYALEYGTDTLEVHKDAVSPGQKVLIVDDLLATGGTAFAALQLLRQMGAEVVGAAFVIELKALNGRKRLEGIDVSALWTV